MDLQNGNSGWWENKFTMMDLRVGLLWMEFLNLLWNYLFIVTSGCVAEVRLLQSFDRKSIKMSKNVVFLH